MSSPPTFYLCIDCGGTKTAAVLASSTGAILARARAGPSNYAYLGLENFVAAVSLAAGLVLAEALGLPPSTPLALPATDSTPAFTIGAAWLAISGVDSPVDIATITPALAALLSVPPGPRLSITNDVHLLGAPLRLRKDVHTGVGCIGGTGSNVTAFREDGAALQELARTGGWGWILGDEGGGFDVGRTALRTLLAERDAESAGVPRAHEGKGLRERVLKRFGVGDVLDLLAVVHLPDPVKAEDVKAKETDGEKKYDAVVAEAVYDPTADPREKRLSSLSPVVFAAAFEDGDPLALQVLRDCAEKLAAQIVTVLNASNSEPSSRRVVAADSIISFGGSVVSIDKYRTLVLDALEKRGHVFRYVEVIDDAAAVGAQALVVAWESKACGMCM